MIENDPDTSNSCYRIAEALEKVMTFGKEGNLESGLKAALGSPDAIGAQMAVIHMYDDALEEVAHLPGLAEARLRAMINTLRIQQGFMLRGMAQDTAKGFQSIIRQHNCIERLHAIGDTIAMSRTARADQLDRMGFVKSTMEMIDDIDRSDLSPIQKAVLNLKLRAILRIVQECHGTSDDQIRRRIKGIFADLTAEFSEIDHEHAGFIEKFKTYVGKHMRYGTIALGLTADTLSVAMIVGPAAMVAIDKPATVLQIEGPQSEKDNNTTQN